jgi:hypothetical protein
MVSDGIRHYISTSKQTNGRTFHVTMTYFWIHMVDFAIRSSVPIVDEKANDSQVTLAPLTDGPSFARFLVLNPHLANGNLWADYYNKDTMMSPQAKNELVLPDKSPLPQIIGRDVVAKAKVG